MKKLILILAVFSLFSIESTYADWSTAKYFQCAVTKRYTAKAKLKPPGQLFYSSTSDGGCTYAETDISSYAVNGTSNCGYAYAYRNKSGSQHSGWADCGWSWGENVDNLPTTFSLSPMKSIGTRKPEGNNLTFAELSDCGIDFDSVSRTISIKNLIGRLKVQSIDVKNNYSTFQIEIYTFSIIDGEPVRSDILWKAKASIIDGKLFLEGEFNPTDFNDTSDGDLAQFEIHGITKGYVVPDSINIENVCVEVSGDGGNLGIGISDKYAPNFNSEEGRVFTDGIISEVDFDSNVIVNPDYVMADLTKNFNDISINEISIISLSGQVIKRKSIASNFDQLKIETSDLSSGIYLLTIKSGETYYSKKFFK